MPKERKKEGRPHGNFDFTGQVRPQGCAAPDVESRRGDVDRKRAREARQGRGVMLDVILAAGVYTPHTGDLSGSLQIELWQVINLVGAPLLAVLFARPVIDDIRAWIRSRNDPDEIGGR